MFDTRVKAKRTVLMGKESMKTYIRDAEEREKVHDAGPSHLCPIVKEVKPRQSSCRRSKDTIGTLSCDPRGEMRGW